MADMKASTAPAAGPLTGAERLIGAQAGNDVHLVLSVLSTWIVARIVDSAPATLDTLNELAAALGDDPNFAATMTAALAGKQPIDSDLTAIAALTTTAFGRSLLEAANAGALRTLAGVAIGSDVQAFSAKLSAIAAATPIADGPHVAGGITITTAGGIITAIS